MSENNYSVAELKAKAVEFISTKGTHNDEWYTTEQALYSIGIDEFFDYLEAPDLEKQKRKELYEQLCFEFEGK